MIIASWPAFACDLTFRRSTLPLDGPAIAASMLATDRSVEDKALPDEVEHVLAFFLAGRLACTGVGKCLLSA